MAVTGLIVAAAVVGSPSSAAAAFASVTIGPLSIPDVPVQVCVNSTCVSTPSLSNASVEASGLTLPVIVPGACPSGQIGAVLTVTSLLPSRLTIGGEISGELVNGNPFELPIGPIPVALGLGQFTTISICTSA